MQIQITNMTNWLCDQGIEQEVITTGFPSIPRILQVNDNLKVNSVRKCTLPLKSRYTGTFMLDESWALGAISWLLKYRCELKFDLLHVHASGVLWPLVIGNIFKKVLNIPMVMTIHCSRLFTYKPMNKFDSFIHPFIKKYERKTIENCEKVILLTDKTCEKYKNLFKDDKFIAIGDSISIEDINHIQGEHCNEVYKSLNIPINKKIVLYVGRVAHEKGWDIFVNMSKEVESNNKDVIFIVCGDGSEKEHMKKLVIEYGLEDIFYFTGFVSHKVIPCILSKADVLVMPSRHEELGGTALEAVCAKTPVIASNVGGLKDIFVDKETAILVESENVSEFAYAVNTLLTDKFLRNKIIINAYNRIIPNFTPENNYDRVKDIYLQVSNNSQ